MSHQSRRCGATRQDGRPCRAWAVRDSDPALCASHLAQLRGEAEASGFYEPAYRIEEAADLLYRSADADLKDELRVSRVAVRRALEQLQQGLDPAEYARLIGLIFKGTHTIADIMRARRSLSGGEEEMIPTEIGEAIAREGRKYGREL